MAGGARIEGTISEFQWHSVSIYVNMFWQLQIYNNI